MLPCGKAPLSSAPSRASVLPRLSLLRLALGRDTTNLAEELHVHAHPDRAETALRERRGSGRQHANSLDSCGESVDNGRRRGEGKRAQLERECKGPTHWKTISSPFLSVSSISSTSHRYRSTCERGAGGSVDGIVPPQTRKSGDPGTLTSGESGHLVWVSAELVIARRSCDPAEPLAAFECVPARDVDLEPRPGKSVAMSNKSFIFRMSNF